VGLVIQAGFWTSAALDVWLRHYRQGDHASDRIRATTVGALHFVIRLVLWSGVTLLALDNLGIDITALVAGLGVGGIAVALAAQTILGDLFASLAIALDKPFLLGDFLVVGEYQGTVEQIGMKTTRLRSLSGEQLIFSNGDLLGSRIRNFQRMTERRVVFKTRLAHDTPREKLRMVPGLIRDAIVQEARIRFDRSHFTGANADGLEHETVYFVLDPDFRLHMDIQQRIGYRLLEAFDREGIEFSRPVHNVHLETDAGGVVSSPQPAPRAGRAGETTSPESGKAADR